MKPRLTYTPLDGRTRPVTLTRWRRCILLALLYADEGIEELKLSELSQTRVWTANGFTDWLETAGWLARYRHNGITEVRLTDQGRAGILRLLRLLE